MRSYVVPVVALVFAVVSLTAVAAAHGDGGIDGGIGVVSSTSPPATPTPPSYTVYLPLIILPGSTLPPHGGLVDNVNYYTDFQLHVVGAVYPQTDAEFPYVSGVITTTERTVQVVGTVPRRFIPAQDSACFHLTLPRQGNEVPLDYALELHYITPTASYPDLVVTFAVTDAPELGYGYRLVTGTVVAAFGEEGENVSVLVWGYDPSAGKVTSCDTKFVGEVGAAVPAPWSIYTRAAPRYYARPSSNPRREK